MKLVLLIIIILTLMPVQEVSACTLRNQGPEQVISDLKNINLQASSGKYSPEPQPSGLVRMLPPCPPRVIEQSYINFLWGLRASILLVFISLAALLFYKIKNRR